MPRSFEEFNDNLDWERMIRESDGELPDLHPDVLLRQYRDARVRACRRRRVWRMAIGLALMVLVLVFLGSQTLPAQAQSQTIERCSSRAEMQATLSERFGEQSIGNGIIGGEPPQLLEVFVSQGGSWSVTITEIDDQSCMQASGMNWKTSPQYRDVQK